MGLAVIGHLPNGIQVLGGPTLSTLCTGIGAGLAPRAVTVANPISPGTARPRGRTTQGYVRGSLMGSGGGSIMGLSSAVPESGRQW